MKNRFSNFVYTKSEVKYTAWSLNDVVPLNKLEQLCFKKAYSINKLVNLLSGKTKAVLGWLPDAKTGKLFIASYCIYDKEDSVLKLRRFVVHPNCRRLYIGSDLMVKMLCRLNDKTHSIEVVLRERNLDAQIFFKTHGFKAQKIIRNQYTDTCEDAYCMVFNSKKTSNDTISLAIISK